MYRGSWRGKSLEKCRAPYLLEAGKIITLSEDLQASSARPYAKREVFKWWELVTWNKGSGGLAFLLILIFLWRCDPTRLVASSFLRFLDHAQRRTTVGRTPLDEWSARRRDLYLTTHNTHNRQTSMPPMGFEPTISAGERLQNYALDRAATGTGINSKLSN